MKISIIVAVDQQAGIGANGGVPWRISSDLRRFKQLTWGHHLVMGRKTYESIGKPLSGRINIILSHNPAYQQPGCLVLHSLLEAIQLAKNSGEKEVFVIGGGELYAEALSLADRIYLTTVETQQEADTFFPAFDRSEWIVLESQSFPASEKDQYPYKYQILERVKNR